MGGWEDWEDDICLMGVWEDVHAGGVWEDDMFVASVQSDFVASDRVVIVCVYKPFALLFA